MYAKVSLRRFRWVALLSLLGFVWLFAILAQSGQATRKEALTYVPFSEGVSDELILQGPSDISFGANNRPDGTHIHNIRLQTSDAAKWSKVDRVGLEFTGLDEQGSFKKAELVIKDHEGRNIVAVFGTHQPASLENNSIPVLERRKPARVDDSPFIGPGTAELEVVTTKPSELSLRVQRSQNKPLSHLLWLQVQDDDNKEVFGSVLGWAQLTDKGLKVFSKAQLLGHMWGFGTRGSVVVYGICGVAALLWAAGLVSIASGFAAFSSFRVAAGAGALLFSILLVYVVISPPFQGPDEADHFLTFADAIGEPTLKEGALALANSGHFERIKRRSNERFTSNDITNPQHSQWALYIFSTPLGRSPLACAMWKAVGNLVAKKDATLSLLILKVTNALFVVICLSVALVVIARLFEGPNPLLWFALPLLLIPSIAYWATAVSNYPFLIGGYAIQTVVLGALWIFVGNPAIGTRQFVPIGLLLGLGLGVALCSADNAIASLAFWALIVPAFLAVRSPSRPAAAFFKESGVFIGSMGAATLALCAGIAAGSGLQRFLPDGISSTVTSVTPVGTSVLAAEFGFILAYLAGITAATVVLLFGIRHIGPLIPALGHRGKRITLVTATIVVLVFLVGQFRIPEITLSKGGETTALKYALSVVLAFADGLLPGPVDPMVSDSFWRKLGWLDTELPKVVRQFLRVAMGLGIILLVAASLFYSSTRACKAFCLANILALISCLATVGIVYYMVLFNVNSRYIMVAYLFTAVLAIEGYRRVFSPAGSVSPGHTMLPCTCLLAISLQCLAWSAVINRYF